MKWLIVFVSFLLGRMNLSHINPSIVFLEKAMEKTRGIIFMTTVAFISALLFSAGVIMAAMNAFSQFDANGVIAFNATISGGLTLVALAVISLATVFSKRNWEVPHIASEAPHHRSPSPIEEAVATLIQDFVQSRQTHRESPMPPPHHERPFEHRSTGDEDQRRGPLH